jgi:hypothetical protein
VPGVQGAAEGLAAVGGGRRREVLNALPAVLSQYGPPHERRAESGSAQSGDVLRAQGLKEAVRLRDAKFDPDISRV